jgi:hypothetical protein
MGEGQLSPTIQVKEIIMKAKKTVKMPMVKGKMPKMVMGQDMADYPAMKKSKKTAKKGKK